MNRYCALFVLAVFLMACRSVTAAALDEIKIDVSHDLCEGEGGNDKNFIVYASNLNSNQAIDAEFKYDSIPARQHFILFDANLNPITDRFPKAHTRRLAPRETASIGCTSTYRAAPQPPRPLSVPIIITKQSASYVDANMPEAPSQDARSFAAFLLQGSVSECGSGAKPPGLFYLVNLHPYARLSASMNLLDDHGTRVGVLAPNLSPLSATRVGCSNGVSRPGPIASATLEVTAGVAASLPAAPPSEATPKLIERRETAPITTPTPTLAPLPLGAILTTQNVCAGSIPPGWIKINDAWNPTVCGKPATITYNVWTIQRFSDEPAGVVIHACKGAVPLGWAIAGTAWNPTMCGHPSTNQSNVMAITRLN